MKHCKLPSLSLLLLLSLLQFLARSLTTAKIVYKTCKPGVALTAIRVTKGWPLRISCRELIIPDDNSYDDYSSTYDYYSDSENTYDCNGDGLINYMCFISDGQKILHFYNGTYNIYEEAHEKEGKHYYVDKLQKNMTFTIYANLPECDNSKCIVSSQKVSVEEPSQQAGNNCEDLTNQVLSSRDYFRREPGCEDLRLNCNERIMSDGNSITNYIPPDGYKVTWYADCNEIDSSYYSEKDDRDSQEYSILYIPQEEIRSGMYSCQISHNNHSKFIKHFQVHLNEKIVKQTGLSVSLQPTSTDVQVEVGSSVNLTCQGTASNHELNYFWTFNEEKVCEIVEGQSSNTCGNYTNYEETIIKYQYENLTGDESCWTITKTISTSLLIHNFQSSDKGQYACVVKTTGSYTTQNITVTVSHAADTEATLHLLHVLIFIASGIIIVGLLCVMFYRCFKIELLLLWKKFFSSYDDDDRDYDVFLSYSFSSEDKSEVEKMLTILMEWFEQKEYSMFNQQLNPAGELHYNQISEIVPKCHRMAIILTKSYLENENSVFDATAGIHGNVNGDTKLIFILTPKVQSYLKQQAKQKQLGFESFLMAMKQKQNSVVLWNGVRRKQGFFKSLEISMPKLPLHRRRSARYNNNEEGHFGDTVSSKKLLNTVTSLVDERMIPDSPHDVLKQISTKCKQEVEI